MGITRKFKLHWICRHKKMIILLMILYLSVFNLFSSNKQELEKSNSRAELATQTSSSTTETTPSNHDGSESESRDLVENSGNLDASEATLHFVSVICQAKTEQSNEIGRAEYSLDRQLLQLEVQIKSILALSQNKVRYHIIADTRQIFLLLTKRLEQFPLQFQKRLKLELYQTKFPQDRKNLRGLFRECATQRLFLLSILPKKLDAAIFLDTDVIFMQDPKMLWKKYRKFKPEEVLAAAPCLNNYGTPFSEVPYYGSDGVNAGILLINFTRLRHFPGRWEDQAMNAFDVYKARIHLAEQDIINIVFNKHPNLLHELTCDWNFRPQFCNTGSNKCPMAAVSGARAVHGSGLGFFLQKEPMFRAFFKGWQSFELGDDVMSLGAKLQQGIQTANLTRCEDPNIISRILSHRLENPQE